MLYFSRKVACLALALILLIASLMPALALSVGVYVNTPSRFFKSPSLSSGYVSIPKGTGLTMTAYSGPWAQVAYGSVTGYMPLAHLNTRSRYAGYISRNTYLFASPSASAAHRGVTVNTKVYVIGRSGDFFRVQNESGSITCYVPVGYVSHTRVAVPSAAASALANWRSRVVKMDWFKGGSDVLPTGSYGYIYDIATGLVVHVKRMGGHNHADLEPASTSDTAKLYKMSGGSFSWASRAVILYSNGRFVACAINTMPHGSQTLTNNGYNGQFCLHMTNSRTHETNNVNAYHQAAINYAYNWAH